ncbi:MAG: UDP-3-O-(3-hydroxymyristoyl)glucosamine N-acyltransferase [Calditrichia bacterium]
MPSYTLKYIAEKIGGKLVGNPALQIHNTAEIDKAGDGEITFLANPKYRSRLEQSNASAVIIDKRVDEPPSLPYIIAPDAYFGFLQALLLFNEPKQMLETGIHETAVVHSGANIGKNVKIGAHVYIGADVSLGDETEIFPNCVILDGSKIGSSCRLYPLASVREDCVIGNRVIIHNGAVIGSDGFGFAPHEGVFHKIPQVGKVVIEDDVEIGANCTIDRATLGETRICNGVKLDNLVHIAHNVVVGSHTVIAGQAGISGSTKIGSHNMIGGQVGIIGHITIGNGVQIAAQSGVSKKVDDGEVLFGSPARPIMKMKRIEASLDHLPEIRKHIRDLEKRLALLEKK